MYLKSPIEHSISSFFNGKDKPIVNVKFNPFGNVDGEPFNFPDDYAQSLIECRKEKKYSEFIPGEVKEGEPAKEEVVEEVVSEGKTDLQEKLEQLSQLEPDALRTAVNELTGKNYPSNTKKETLLKAAEKAL